MRNEPVSRVGPAPLGISQRADVGGRILGVIRLIRPGFTPLASGSAGGGKRGGVGGHGPRRMLFVASGRPIFSDVFEAGCVAYGRRRRRRRGGRAARSGGRIGTVAVVVDAHPFLRMDEGIVVAAFLARSRRIGWEPRARGRRNPQSWRIASATVDASAGSVEIFHSVSAAPKKHPRNIQ